MNLNKKITKQQHELIKKIKIIKVNENEYVVCLKFLPDELLEETIQLCKDEKILWIRLEPQDIGRLQKRGIRLNSKEFSTYFYCDTISQAPIDLLEQYGVQRVLIGAKENINVEKMSIETYRIIFNKLIGFVKDILPDESDEDKFKKVYKRLGEMLEYDYLAAGEGEYVEQNENKCRNLENAVLLNKAVCAGFAETLKQTLSLIGIECLVCSSLGDKHVYNIAKINGRWYNADLTWDYRDIRKKKKPKFCLKSDDDFKKCKEHERMYHIPKDNVQKCESSLDVFKEYKISITDKLKEFLKTLFSKNKNENFLSQPTNSLNNTFKENIRVVPKKEKGRNMKRNKKNEKER